MKKDEKDLFDLFVKRLVTQGAGKNDNSIIGMIFIADAIREGLLTIAKSISERN